MGSLDKLVEDKAGFTLIEILLVIGVFAILSALATINLLRPQTQASLDSVLIALVSDTKLQQLKAMVGDTAGQATSTPWGIYFEANRYTLFRGLSYSPAEPTNFTVNLDDNVTLVNINFPSSQVVFLKRSGEISNYQEGLNSLTVKNTQSNQQKTMTINRYGAITVN